MFPYPSSIAMASPPLAVGDHSDVQKKTFGKWLNTLLEGHCDLRVTDLFYDLRDGLLLLAALEKLTGRRMRREKGSLRVHKLSNVAAALCVLKEERVKLVNVNNVDVVDGNPKITLALVWAVILHWQFDKVLRAECEQGLHGASGLERCLLAWVRTWTRAEEYRAAGVDVRDFSHSWCDGMALAALLHAHRPDAVDFAGARAMEPAERLRAVFGAVQEHLAISPLLDPEDLCGSSRPDKKSVMTYVMCLFQALPHEDIDMGALDDLSSSSRQSAAAAENLIGSPLRMPIQNLKNGETRFFFLIKATLKGLVVNRLYPFFPPFSFAGKPLTYDLFCAIHEDVLEWLLDVEDKLDAFPAVERTELSRARGQYQSNRAFLFEVEAQDSSVGEVREDREEEGEDKRSPPSFPPPLPFSWGREESFFSLLYFLSTWAISPPQQFFP